MSFDRLQPLSGPGILIVAGCCNVSDGRLWRRVSCDGKDPRVRHRRHGNRIVRASRGNLGLGFHRGPSKAEGPSIIIVSALREGIGGETGGVSRSRTLPRRLLPSKIGGVIQLEVALAIEKTATPAVILLSN